MMVSGLILLPLLALVLIFNGTWMETGKSIILRPRKQQRRHRAKVLLHRCGIVSLVVATIVAYRMPIDTMSDLALGTILTMVFMVPVCIYLIFLELNAPRATVEEMAEVAHRRDYSSHRWEGSSAGESKGHSIPLIERRAPMIEPEDDSTEEDTIVAALRAEVSELKELVHLQRATLESEKRAHEETRAALADASVVIKNAVRKDAMMQNLLSKLQRAES